MKNVSLKILSGLGIVMLMLTTMMTPANAGKISDTKTGRATVRRIPRCTLMYRGLVAHGLAHLG